MIYKLKIHGDKNERKYYKSITSDFPNYEILWSKYIVPWSNRDLLPITDIRWIQPRLNIPPIIEGFLMIHYSVFMDMIFIINQIDNECNEQRNSLRDIYSYFGHTIEMVNSLAIKILQIEIMVGICKDNLFIEKDEKVLISDFRKNFIDNGLYNKKFKNYKAKQIPVTYTVHGNRTILKKIIKNTENLEGLEEYFLSIQNYRNWLTHSPLPGCIEVPTHQGKIRFVVKKESIDKYPRWTDFANINDNNIDDFVEERTLVREEFRIFKTKLNILWDLFITNLDKIYRSPKMIQILDKTKVNNPERKSIILSLIKK